MLPRQQQRYTLLIDEFRFAKQREHFVPEQQLGGFRVNPRDRNPLTALRPTTPADEGMNVRMEIDRRAKGLDHGHHAGTDRLKLMKSPPLAIFTYPEAFSESLQRNRALGCGRIETIGLSG
ncbi:MAG: hypothetical protein M3P29_01520 [Acidobacteriota bacterium]|nr:hypothetical protein [Acidobacteriota bacterium]